MGEAMAASSPEVVLVEDEALVGLMIEVAFIEAGFSVHTFKSGSDALAYLAAGGRADVLFADVDSAGDIDGVPTTQIKCTVTVIPCSPVIRSSWIRDHERPSGCGPLLDRFDAIGIEGEMILDLCDRGERILVRPHGIRRAYPTQRDAVIGAFAL